MTTLEVYRKYGYWAVLLFLMFAAVEYLLGSDC